MGYNLYIPSPLVGGGALRSAIYLWTDGVADFFSCADSETSGNDFLAETLINVLPDFILESFGVETGTLNGGKPGDVLSSFQRFNAHAVHMPLDFVLDGFDFGGGFGGKLLPLFEGFNLGNDFDSGHFGVCPLR